MRRNWLLAPVACLLLAACSGGDDGDRVTLQVYAASSLTDAFDTLEESYEQENPDVDVVLTYDSSATLATQVVEGADVDVLATADEPTMATAVQAGRIAGTPTPFATNTLVIVTPPDNPGGVVSINELGSADFAVCVETAPCGAATRTLFELNGFNGVAITEEDNVRGVLEKVVSGSVDAGLVYTSDALAAGDDVQTFEARRSEQVVNVDPIALVEDSDAAEHGQAWVDLVLSPEGQGLLEELGFGPPEPAA